LRDKYESKRKQYENMRNKWNTLVVAEDDLAARNATLEGVKDELT
jgi:hypothetical protein